jgi:aminoglycoside phosphotransferase family enzyme/predicted kinase
MTTAQGQAATAEAVIAWLRAGGPWGVASEVIETHAALVFLNGDRAFKMKKRVSLGYLNFTSLDVRRETLARELVLNKRTAPGIYLQTLPVVAEGGAFRLGGAGEAVEWLLEMRRFPDAALLSHLQETNALTEPMIERLARHAARFHDEVPVVAGADWPVAVGRVLSENAADLRSLGGAFDAGFLQDELALRNALHVSAHERLSKQSSDVRHCHGDMHLGNVFLDGEEPTLFDCIEFDDFYAVIPPLYDLSFLLMDLLVRGESRYANRALNAWVNERAVDLWPEVVASLPLLPLYLAMRAEIRAKVEARRPGGAETSLRYLRHAAEFAVKARPRLVAIGGFSGTGKSTLAKALALRMSGACGALHLRTDEIRKRLAGVRMTETLPSSAYTAEASDLVYDTMIDLARMALAAGFPVIVDAVFSKPDERGAVERVARELGVPFDGLWLEAPADVLKDRLHGRKDDASDADLRVLQAQLVYDIGSMTWSGIDVAGTPVDAESVARRLLVL